MSGVLPCPWCGCTEPPTSQEGSTYRWRTVECAGCGAGPGEIRKAADPLAAWNTRATPTPQAQAGDAAFEAWNGALIEAGEIAGNATDERIKRRGERLVAYLKSHRPPQAPASDAGAVAQEPWGWAWSHGSDHGILTLRQDYDSHRRQWPTMTFQPLSTHPAAASDDAREVERLREALQRIADFEGNPSTPVYNSTKKSGIARAALSSPDGLRKDWKSLKRYTNLKPESLTMPPA